MFIFDTLEYRKQEYEKISNDLDWTLEYRYDNLFSILLNRARINFRLFDIFRELSHVFSIVFTTFIRVLDISR